MTSQHDEAVMLLDDSAYPVTRLYPDRVTSLARFQRLCAKWDRVIARDGPFVIISFGDHPADEPHEVARERALFFKRNRDVFRERCAVIINVEPNADERVARRAEIDKVTKALGFRLAVVATEEEALGLAQQHLPHARA